MTHDVFICHSSQDRTLANAIVAKLEEHGIRCWVAPRDVVPGLEYAESIIEAIGRSKLTVLVFSAHANSSPHVRRELERTASHGIPILPFRVEDVLPAPSVEYFISDAHWLDAMTPPMEQHLEHLVGTVRLLLARQASRSGTAALGAETERAAAPVPAAPSSSTSAATIASSGGAGPPRRIGKGVLYAAGAGVVLIAVVIALVLALNRPGAAETAAPDSQATEQQTTAQQTSEGESDGAAEEIAAPVIIEFDDGLGEGWTWENEDTQAWSVDGGALRLDVQQSPPLRNVLLRDLPAGDAVIQTRIEFDPAAPSHAAGIILTGDDIGDRVELCWTTEGLFLHSVEDDVMVDGVEIAPDQFAPEEWVGAELSFEIGSGFYSAAFQSDTTPDWQIHTAPLPDFVTRAGLIAYTTEEAGEETAVFTRFVLQ